MALAVVCARLSGANRDPVAKTAFEDLQSMDFSPLLEGWLLSSVNLKKLDSPFKE